MRVEILTAENTIRSQDGWLRLGTSFAPYAAALKTHPGTQRALDRESCGRAGLASTCLDLGQGLC